MTFIEYGLNIQNPLPVKTDTEKGYVTQTHASQAGKKIEDELHHEPDSNNTRNRKSHSEAVESVYREVQKQTVSRPVITAGQIMSSPVISISTNTRIGNILNLFRQNSFRHLPVVDPSGNLVGMISDRDLLHYVGAVTDTFEIRKTDHNLNNDVTNIMKTPVLTASTETDVRYIARLFVKQHIGALPVVKDHRLAGIISRTDIMRAVMSHYKLELWT